MFPPSKKVLFVDNNLRTKDYWAMGTRLTPQANFWGRSHMISRHLRNRLRHSAGERQRSRLLLRIVSTDRRIIDTFCTEAFGSHSIVLSPRRRAGNLRLSSVDRIQCLRRHCEPGNQSTFILIRPIDYS